MARVRAPKQSRSKATFTAIVESATRILVESGWQAVNTNRVAERAGVSVGSLYEYFPNKQAIFDAIAINHLDEGKVVFRRVAETMTSRPSAEEVVTGLVNAIVTLHQGSPELHRQLSSEVPLSEHVKQEVQQIRQLLLSYIASLLSPHLEQPDLVAQILFDSTDAVVHKWYVEEGGEDVGNEVLKGQLLIMLKAYVRSLRPGQS